MDGTVSARIHKRHASLTRTERIVARVLLEGYPMAGLRTVADLASAANTSGPTILRLVGKLGFDRYADFQQALRAEVGQQLDSPIARFDAFAQSSRDGSLSASFAESVVHNVRRSIEMVPQSEFDAVVDMLADESRNVHTLAVGLTEPLAEYLHRLLHFVRTGSRNLAAGPGSSFHDLMHIKKGDIVIAFQMPRHTREVQLAIKRSAEKRAKVVLFADQAHAEEAMYCDHVFVSSIRAPSPFDSFTACVMQVEILVASLIERMGPTYRARLSDFEDLRVSQPSESGTDL